ncbi:MAG TPA: hypothetical protein VL977_03840 [Solirubrobacteraceae bacterium]|nr:hypothetical protein [Solirubrobacteraceae bacterium]
MSATLVLSRASRLPDAIWPYRVEVDGEPAGTIRNGQTLRIAVAAGSHRLQIRSLHIVNRRLGLASPAVTFEFAGDATGAYECHPHALATAPLWWLRCVCGDRTGWITLTQSTDGASG